MLFVDTWRFRECLAVWKRYRFVNSNTNSPEERLVKHQSDARLKLPSPVNIILEILLINEKCNYSAIILIPKLIIKNRLCSSFFSGYRFEQALCTLRFSNNSTTLSDRPDEAFLRNNKWPPPPLPKCRWCQAYLKFCRCWRFILSNWCKKNQRRRNDER